ncbi:hypothetical protein Rsub_04473 [Raphidocelis subcapitata]|uniref:Poly A polymerase head domain-containing protein n=1 Tax=Raphidocelis subcapitata TaxID=307507 RepID=A0A2V0NWX6_9CHLO|nr:hypothetical protein Rsub_04473 [Raphidocelis subcapitata]|eukprot:GBF92126.1 hypothetical protein Rsub_04473 [Raphidocelis subcapitata]
MQGAAAAARGALQQRDGAPLLAALRCGRGGGGGGLAACAAGAAARASSSSTGGGVDNGGTDWLGGADGAGVRVARHALPDAPLSEDEARSLANATEVITRLSDAGCFALIAGGWVKRLFPRVIDLPRSTVKLSHNGELFEVATFRGFSKGEGLASAAMDAEARDFTANSLYYCPLNGVVLDFVGGVPDINARTLRLSASILGNRGARLLEDPLRVMRAVRFAVGLGFKLDPETAGLLTQHAYRCSVEEGVPARRIWLELRKLAALDEKLPGSWSKCLALAYHLGLLPHLFPWLRGGGAAAAQQAVLASARLCGAGGGGGGGGGGQSSVGSDVGESGGGGGGQSRGDDGGIGSGGGGGEQRSGDDGGGESGGVPLELRVAALVHPSSSRAVYEMPFVYFQTPDERSAIETLALAAQLARQPARPGSDDAGGGDSASGSSSSSSGGGGGSCSGGGGGDGASLDRQWARVYGHERGALQHQRQLAPLVAAARAERRRERDRAAAEAARELEARRRRAEGPDFSATLDTLVLRRQAEELRETVEALKEPAGGGQQQQEGQGQEQEDCAEQEGQGNHHEQQQQQQQQQQ